MTRSTRLVRCLGNEKWFGGQRHMLENELTQLIVEKHFVYKENDDPWIREIDYICMFVIFHREEGFEAVTVDVPGTHAYDPIPWIESNPGDWAHAMFLPRMDSPENNDPDRE